MPTASTSHKLLIWLTASLFFAYQFLLRVFPHVVNPQLMERFDTSAAGIAQFLGVYYIGYTLAHIPIAILLDRVGAKIILPICIFLVCLGLLPLNYSSSLLYATLGRVLIGIGSAAGVLGVFKVLRTYYSSDRIPFLFGVSVSIGLLGAACGGQPFYYSVNHWGWEYTINALITVGVFLAIIIFAIIPAGSGEESKKEPFLKDIKILSSHYKWLLLAILGGLMVGPVEGFTDGWAMAFLASYYPKWDVELLCFLPSLILIGMGIGGPILGYIAEKTQAYYKIIAISGLVMGLIFVILLKFTLNLPIVIILFICVGLASAYQTVVLYYASLLVPQKVAGLTIACANMIIMCFGYIFHTVLGALMDYNKGDDQSSYLYAPEVFSKAFIIFPAALLTASVAFILMEAWDKRALRAQQGYIKNIK